MTDKNNNTGDWNTGDLNTGDWNTGDWNTGNRNTGDSNTGDWNTGDWNTGDCNTGDRNTGDRNTGNWNTGDRNTGDRNTGDCNTGNWNTGNWNTGDRNTGNWNTVNKETGFFNTEKTKTIRVFNKCCDYDVWNEAEIPYWLYFYLTEWVSEEDMTEKEKKDNPTYKTTGGYLKVYDYKEAFQKSYAKATREEQLKVTKLPNFDSDVFFEISGIRVETESVEELTMEQICKELGREVKIKK